MHRIITAFATSLAIAACAHSEPPDVTPATYRLVIDSAFVGDEADAILRAADLWSVAVGPDLTWSPSLLSRRAIDDVLSREPQPRTVYVVRIDSMTEIQCLSSVGDTGQMATCFQSGRVFLAANDLGAKYGWDTATLHGIGHGLGLRHQTAYSSVMVPEQYSVPRRPTEYDVAAFCAVNGCPRRGK